MLLIFKREMSVAMNNATQNQQQDAHEAMTKIFEACKELLLYIRFNEDLTTRCHQCRHEGTVTHEHNFLVLHPSSKNMPLQECIDVYQEAQQVEGYRCDSCGSASSIFNTTQIQSCPPVLLIQLGQLGNHTDNCVTPDLEISINGTSYVFQSAIYYDGFFDSGQSAGHYESFTCISGNWFRFNDSHVTSLNEQGVAVAAPKFYILCYKKL